MMTLGFLSTNHIFHYWTGSLSSWGTIIKKHRWSGLNNGSLFLIVLEAWKFKIKCVLIQCFVKISFQACRWLSSGYVLTWWRESSHLSSTFYENTCRLPLPHYPTPAQDLIQTQLPTTGPTFKYHHTGGYGFSIWIFGTHKHPLHNRYRMPGTML